MDNIIQRKRRGYYVERKLVKMLSKKSGNYVFRIPVSGSRSSRKLITAFPDVFLVNNQEDRIVAFEVKIKKAQIIKLSKFLYPFKKYSKREAVLAVWFIKQGKWVFRKVDGAIISQDVVIHCDDESNWTP